MSPAPGRLGSVARTFPELGTPWARGWAFRQNQCCFCCEGSHYTRGTRGAPGESPTPAHAMATAHSRPLKGRPRAPGPQGTHVGPRPHRGRGGSCGSAEAARDPPVSGPGQGDAPQALPCWARHRGGSEARAAKPRPPACRTGPPLAPQPSAAQARVNLPRNKLTAGGKAIASCQDEAWVSAARGLPPCRGNSF